MTVTASARTFVEQHCAVGRRRRNTARCRAFVARQVGAECRAVAAVAVEVGMGWRAANSVVLAEIAAAGCATRTGPLPGWG